MSEHIHKFIKDAVWHCKCGVLETKASEYSMSEQLRANDISLSKLAHSNSKSEDTPYTYNSNEPYCVIHKHGHWTKDCPKAEPPKDTSLDRPIDIWEAMFGNMTEAKAGIYTCDYKRFLELTTAWHKAERAKLFEQIRSEVNNMYELSITDLEKRQYQQGVEIPVLSKTQVLEALTRMEENE